MKKIFLLMLSVVCVFAFTFPVNSHAGYDYQSYYSACKSGKAGMKLRSVTGEYRMMTCKEYANYKLHHTYPSWVWTNRNPGHVSGNNGGGGYSPAPHVYRPSKVALDRKLKNERYKVGVRIRNYVFNSTLRYLDRVNLNNYNKYMWRMNVESNIVGVTDCVTKRISSKVINAYNKTSSQFPDYTLRKFVDYNLESDLKFCTKRRK